MRQVARAHGVAAGIFAGGGAGRRGRCIGADRTEARTTPCARGFRGRAREAAPSRALCFAVRALVPERPILVLPFGQEHERRVLALAAHGRRQVGRKRSGGDARRERRFAALPPPWRGPRALPLWPRASERVGFEEFSPRPRRGVAEGGTRATRSRAHVAGSASSSSTALSSQLREGGSARRTGRVHREDRWCGGWWGLSSRRRGNPRGAPPRRGENLGGSPPRHACSQRAINCPGARRRAGSRRRDRAAPQRLARPGREPVGGGRRRRRGARDFVSCARRPVSRPARPELAAARGGSLGQDRLGRPPARGSAARQAVSGRSSRLFLLRGRSSLVLAGPLPRAAARRVDGGGSSGGASLLLPPPPTFRRKGAGAGRVSTRAERLRHVVVRHLRASPRAPRAAREREAAWR